MVIDTGWEFYTTASSDKWSPRERVRKRRTLLGKSHVLEAPSMVERQLRYPSAERLKRVTLACSAYILVSTDLQRYNWTRFKTRNLKELQQKRWYLLFCLVCFFRFRSYYCAHCEHCPFFRSESRKRNNKKFTLLDKRIVLVNSSWIVRNMHENISNDTSLHVFFLQIIIANHWHFQQNDKHT